MVGEARPQRARSAPPWRWSGLESPKLRLREGRTGEKRQNRLGSPPSGSRRTFQRWVWQSRGRARCETLWQSPVSHPRLSSRTCGSPASGFPSSFIAGSRRAANVDMSEPDNSELPKHQVITEAASASGRPLMPPRQEAPYDLVDVVVDHAIGSEPSPLVQTRRDGQTWASTTIRSGRRAVRRPPF